MTSEPDRPQRRAPSIGDFLADPTRDLADWQWLWSGDQPFPIRSHRGLLGRIVVSLKRLLRPLVKVPQNDLWERQRTFNLILLEHLGRLETARADHLRRIEYQEALDAEGIQEIMRHNDALFARTDQKLDRYRREARNLLGNLGGALAAVQSLPQGALAPVEVVAAIARVHEEHGYVELERLYRGTEEEIRERIAAYRPFLKDLPAGAPVLDLGCGRGEALALLREWGLAGRGVDASARMVEICRDRGVEAEVGDLFAVLAAAAAGSLGAVVSFHVIEHLPPAALDRLVRLAWRALRPGGVLILETPNPLSVVVAARNFWLDPTHVRPVHPESLRLMYELAGFAPVERLDLRPFAVADRLPEIDLAKLPADQRPLADQVNRLRDRLDDLLFGCQDFGMVGKKP
ncbi:MAG TPA: class I SAM-dependent methyltransferase [Thermoanaerobaculia bacterium]|jgi:O-antigen chain-terminating methyltransferase|nr:class I SAM-dependent methyltransferase [Thermoanaerobaculia bacterium]